MKSWFKILALCVTIALLGVVDNVDLPHAALPHSAISSHDLTTGEMKSSSSNCPASPIDFQVLSAPVQVPAIVPTQGVRLLAPVKHRTTLTRTNILRRSANRLSDNVYAPLALSGQFVVERVSSPLPHRAVYYHVITLCRLLC